MMSVGSIDRTTASTDTGSHGEFPPYIQPTLQRECAVEFVDWRWLMTHCLDSEAAALEYFYLSPFYTQRDRQQTLNERMRRGELAHDSTDFSQQQGLLFSVTYSNITLLRERAPAGMRGFGKTVDKTTAEHNGVSAENEEEDQICKKREEEETTTDFAARCNYINPNALFHITLLRREASRHGTMLTVPLCVYAIIGGKIYRMAPLIDILQQKMASAVQHLERCFDLLQLRLARWDLNEGNLWWARLSDDREEGPRSAMVAKMKQGIEKSTASSANSIVAEGSCAVHLCDKQKKSAKDNAVRSRWSQREEDDFHCDSSTWVEEDGCLIREVFKKTYCEPAGRILAAEQKRLGAEIQKILEKKQKNEEQWRAAKALEAALAAALQKKVTLYRQYKCEELKRLPLSQQLSVLRRLQQLQQQRQQELQRLQQQEEQQQQQSM